MRAAATAPGLFRRSKEQLFVDFLLALEEKYLRAEEFSVSNGFGGDPRTWHTAASLLREMAHLYKIRLPA